VTDRATARRVVTANVWLLSACMMTLAHQLFLAVMYAVVSAVNLLAALEDYLAG